MRVAKILVLIALVQGESLYPIPLVLFIVEESQVTGTAATHHGIVLTVLLALVVNDLLAVIHALLVLSVPEAEVSQERIDTGTGKTVARTVVLAAVVLGESREGMYHHGVEVLNERLDNLVTIDGRHGLYICIGLDGEGVVRHILEGTYQVEIAEVADGSHFGLGSHHVTLGISRILLCYLLTTLGDDVALADDSIESRPVGIGIGTLEVFLQTAVEVKPRGGIAALGDVVTTGLTPHDAAFEEGISLHLHIDTGHHLVNVGLLVPEVVLRNEGLGLDIEEVTASGESQGSDSYERERFYFIEVFHNDELC